MNNTIPIYDVILDDENLGLMAISFVDDPAIQTDFIAFGNQVPQMIWMSNKEKREIVSPILIPNQLILRKAEDGKFYYIRWTKETIALAAQRYLANGWFNNVTVMHPTFYNSDMTYEEALEKDVYMLRMWTIEDEKKDDANTKYGFNLPEGTLMVHMKVHNRKIWQRIKSGELKGLSIEAVSNIVRSSENKQINQKKIMDINTKQFGLFQKFVQFLNEVSEEAKALSDIAKGDEAEAGEVSLKYFIDDDHYIEVGADGIARDEAANVVAEGEYMLADGNYIVVDANGKFVETHAKAETEEEPVEAPIAEQKVDDDEDDKKDEEPVAEPEGESAGEDDGSVDEADDEKPADVDESPADEGEAPAVEEELVPFEIDGVEYQLPKTVVKFIEGILGEKDEAVAEIKMMKEKTPSVNPIPMVISQSETKEVGGLVDAIRLLNRK